MVSSNTRKRGNELISQGFFLGDTSGRTRELNEKAVFAICSKKMQFSVKMESKEKIKVFNKLKKKYKSEEKIKEIIHSVKIYFAIQGFIENVPGFYICCGGFNERNLVQELRNRLGEKFIPKKFHLKSSLIPLFGKHNMADKLAGEVRNGKKKANLILNEKHFRKLGLIEKNKRV